ncbi:patatin-like phospholipase family protein [Novosphingobium sp.]|uniref:patatin-like phospholipase family protein n=1 Tax=Novosphingobium sp. TaxID=1874826 RepID=UPI00260F0376|nr:patatin-like phospholipase family protein [Novosphingobium sp.]
MPASIRPSFIKIVFLAASLALSGCATIHREPFNERQQAEATIPGMPQARFWADAPGAARLMAPAYAGAQGERSMLALSGGSDNGAYGAGLLEGWTKSGTRPEFAVVTGVSTGALIAPFAFLGSDQDATLEALFTGISAKNIYKNRFPLVIPLSPSIASTKPLARMIETVLTDALIDQIGAEHTRGRRLFVGTANLDAQRMVIWNMGAIAASKAPGRYGLFRQVLLASSAIPAFFPPVMIKAEAGGRTISEMHVDGGTTAQILTLPDEAIVTGQVPAAARPLHMYMIVNNKLNGEFKLVKPRTVPIASQAISLNLRRATASTVNLSYLYAKAQGIDFNLSFIGKDYPANSKNLFDTAFMRGLFAYGRSLGETGTFWAKRPPDEDE